MQEVTGYNEEKFCPFKFGIRVYRAVYMYVRVYKFINVGKVIIEKQLSKHKDMKYYKRKSFKTCRK